MSGYQVKHGRSFRARIVKVIIWILAFCLTAYILGPPLYWHTSEALVSRFSCPPCLCDDCSSHSLPSISQGLNITSFIACMKNDPDMTEEMEKTIINQLSEELKLMESEATETQHIADKTLLETKKLVSQYQKEADKCTSGMETCEEAREKAEIALRKQQENTARWELRARQKGWKDDGPLKSTLRILDHGKLKVGDIDHM
ncbi:uncharacterized protein LOC108198165 [Daucus carota subsp. sativus]|uniref:uncharacterized protein LOC108198165 n=1 Tax=Daucus carota subsp. sativus TaxID=79200 RepID=UPI0007DEFC4B|nr:PREDICTED: uncharacterized protein LOC108198165 [Daucus carota subsp. sativus]